MDPLQEVGTDRWPQLDILLKQNWPRSFIIYSWLNTRRKWFQKDPKKYDYHVLCPNGNIQQGIVTFGKTGDRVFYLTVFTFDKDLSPLKEALIRTKLIPWMDKFVCGVPQGIDLWFQDILKSHNCKVHHNTPTHYYRLPKDVAEKIEIKHGNDIYIDYLSNIDIPKINHLWDHKFEGSEHLLRECINMNYGVGVYSKQNGNLLSWGMKYEYSDVAVVKTEAEYRKRGYGKLVFQSLSKKIAEEGEDVITFIVPGNVASENITRNIGYKYAGTYNWLEYDLEKERSKL